MNLPDPEQAPRWLLLIHQLPPKPAYLRVKIGRHLARVGAVALKSTVYVLPRSDTSEEDFQWIRREVQGSGGEATLLAAALIDGTSDAEVEQLFRNARDADYAELAEGVRDLSARCDRATDDDDALRPLGGELERLERRSAEISELDFFGASGRVTLAALVSDLRARLTHQETSELFPMLSHAQYLKRTWVTRTGVYVDRIASAWLIRRFVDPEATFKFVAPKGYEPLPGELRFDMFEAEFSHEGDSCTFEVILARFAIAEPGLGAIAEIIHDLDVKDGKYGHPETAGVAAFLEGLTLLHADDLARLSRGSDYFDGLLLAFAKRRKQA